MYGLVFVKYINNPIICLYKVAFTISDEVSLNNLGFVGIGVVMDLQSQRMRGEMSEFKKVIDKIMELEMQSPRQNKRMQ